MRQWLLALWLLLTNLPAVPDVIANGKLHRPSRNEVVLAFTGKLKRWGSGDPVVVYVLPREHPATQRFVFDILGITPSALEAAIELDQSRAHPTLVRVQSELQMYRAVATTVGAIGYVSNVLLVNRNGELVKIVPMQ